MTSCSVRPAGMPRSSAAYPLSEWGVVPNDGETGAAPVVLPADLVADRGTTAERRRIVDWRAIAAAALLNALIVLGLLTPDTLLWDWRVAPPEPEPPAVPVQLVMEPPPEPAPAPAPAPPPPAPPPQALKYRESGEDDRTTAPAVSENTGPETSTPPQLAPPASTATSPTQIARGAINAKPRKEAMRMPERKEAEVSHQPRPQVPHIDMELGDRYLSGDPYLNLMKKIILRHWIVPKVLGEYGLPLSGIAVFTLIIDRRGNLTGVTLEQSSGAQVLDQAGERMLREAAPFPPPPADVPGTNVTLHWTLSLYSEAP
jgi:periplasmic protein TonB